jgi:hypothetical protein
MIRRRIAIGLTVLFVFGLALVLPRQSLARPFFTAWVVGECVTYNDITYNMTASTGINWLVSDVEWVFNPTPAQLATVDDPSGKIRYFLVPPGTYDVSAKTQANFPSIIAPDCAPPPKGLTWKLVSTNSPTGTVRVGCGAECDPYLGDVECTEALPLLCIKKAGTGFPLPRPTSVSNSSFYNRWSGGIIGTTSPTVPPKKLSEASALCVKEFGTDWRVAEFHDGWGWYFQAYGGVSDPSKRFWININDQPGATCWH